MKRLEETALFLEDLFVSALTFSGWQILYKFFWGEWLGRTVNECNVMLHELKNWRFFFFGAHHIIYIALSFLAEVIPLSPHVMRSFTRKCWLSSSFRIRHLITEKLMERNLLKRLLRTNECDFFVLGMGAM